MRVNEDDSLQPVASSIAGAPRAITPNKLRKCNSPGNLLRQKNSPLRTIIAESNISARARSTSRRKQRQWENSHFFGMEAILLGEMGNDASPEFLFHGGEDTISNTNNLYPFKVEWRTNLGELFAAKKFQALENFRNVHPSSCPGGHSSSNPTRRKAAAEEWQDAEESFLKIEKRLRSVIGVACAKSAQVLHLLQSIETVVLFAALFRIALPLDLVGADLQCYLLTSPEMDSDGQLRLPLKDSAFHRLLVHGVCQFYGLKSKSTMSKKSKQKVTVIKLGSSLSVAVQQRLSFSGYLSRSCEHRVVTLEDPHTHPKDSLLTYDVVSVEDIVLALSQAAVNDSHHDGNEEEEYIMVESQVQS